MKVFKIALYLIITTIVYGQTSAEKIIKNYNQDLFLVTQEKGNFTNSGFTEILAFYQKTKDDTEIDIAICYIVDESKDEILEYFILKYSTYIPPQRYAIPMLQNFSKQYSDAANWTMLGRPVFFNGSLLGYIGDFNKNGTDELYLYYFYGNGALPEFYEFNKQEKIFKTILKPGWGNVFIISEILQVEKRLNFIGLGNDPGDKPQYYSYIWDDKVEMYVQIQK